MLKQSDSTWAYDYDFVENEDEPGASIWVAGPDGKPAINIAITINEKGVEVLLWPMDGYENLTNHPASSCHLDFVEVARLKGDR